MFPYLMIFCIISINALINQKYNKYINIMCFMFLLLSYSLRNNIGNDWVHYKYYFDHIFSYSLINKYNFEIGFQLLNYVGKFIFKSFRPFVFVVGVFNGLLFWKSTNRYTKEVGLVMLLSLYYLFFPSIEAFRQSITLFIFYYSLEFINDNQRKYLFLNLIGLLFHRTGIFTFFFYLFHKYKKSQIAIILFLLFFALLEPYVLQLLIKVFPVIGAKYYWYFHVETANNPLFTFKLLEYLLILFYFMFTRKSKSFKGIYEVSNNLVFLGFFLQITLGRMSDIIYRVNYYTDIGIIFTYVFVYEKIKRPLFKHLYMLIMVLYVLVRFYRIFPFNNQNYFAVFR